MSWFVKFLIALCILSSIFFACGQAPAVPGMAAAGFALSNLEITPSTAYPGDPVEISIDVKNTGAKSGDYIVELKINGAVESSQTVILDGGFTDTVTFTVTKNAPGDYMVDVNSQAGKFSLMAREVPPETVVVDDAKFDRIAHELTGRSNYSYIVGFIDGNKMKVTSAVILDFDVSVCNGQLCFLRVPKLAWENIFEVAKDYFNYDNKSVMTLYYLTGPQAEAIFGKGITALPEIQSVSTSNGKLNISFYQP